MTQAWNEFKAAARVIGTLVLIVALGAFALALVVAAVKFTLTTLGVS